LSLISKKLTFLENAAAEDELYDSVADLLLTIINRTQLSINLSNVTFGKCVLERAGAKKSLLATVITRKLRYLITKVMRKSGDCVEEETAQSTLPERNKKVRLKKSWNGNITAWTTIKPEQLMRQVEEHPEWRQNVANPQTEDG